MMKKTFSSIIVGMLLTVSVANAQVQQAPSAVAECANIVLPNYYQPGISPMNLIGILEEECGDILTAEIEAAGMEVDSTTKLAGLLFYSTEWLNRMLQDTLVWIGGNCTEMKDPDAHLDI